MQHTFTDARIGFALASKVLLLREGLRKINVTIVFKDDMLTQRLTRLVSAMYEAGEESNDSDDTSSAAMDAIRRQDVFLKVFRRIFHIAVTGEHGWITIPAYLPACDERKLMLSFELPPQEAAVVAYDATLHGENYAVATPMIRFVINPGAYLFPYGMLRDLTIAGAHIDVQVSGCRDLVLHNNVGQLSAAAPFAPFGPLPKLGSYLVIGSSEMACKQLSSFSVEVEWADLTRLNGGFPTYYDGYGVELTNDDFLASAGVLARGSWLPAAGARPTVQLFRADVQPGQGERLNRRVAWNCNRIVHLCEPDSSVSAGKPFVYGPGAKNGFFKFTLVAPAFAFGHEAYPSTLSATLVANSRTKRLRRQRPVPRAPYTPADQLDLGQLLCQQCYLYRPQESR